MKRVLQYKVTDDGYGCFENDECVFLVKKSDLQFNVKDFYQAFYAEGNDFEEISVEDQSPADNREAGRVFQCITTLITQIDEKIKEIPEESYDEDETDESHEDEEE